MLRILPFLLAAPLLIAGCTATTPSRFAVEAGTLDTKQRTSAKSISITKVTLPAYAKETGIFVRDASGALVPVPRADWADEPERAMTLALVRNLSASTDAQVAGDPWPLGGTPEAEVRIDVDEMIVDSSNTMTLSGQFSIRRDEATTRNRIKRFNIRTRAASQKAGDIVNAHGSAWRRLAGEIGKAL